MSFFMIATLTPMVYIFYPQACCVVLSPFMWGRCGSAGSTLAYGSVINPGYTAYKAARKFFLGKNYLFLFKNFKVLSSHHLRNSGSVSLHNLKRLYITNNEHGLRIKHKTVKINYFSDWEHINKTPTSCTEWIRVFLDFWNQLFISYCLPTEIMVESSFSL